MWTRFKKLLGSHTLFYVKIYKQLHKIVNRGELYYDLEKEIYT